MVIVIIGLIAGSIFYGHEMVKHAEIRSTITQIEKFISASYDFKSKYRYLPGDIYGTDAARHGMQARAGTVGHGDGNGLVEGGAAGSTLAFGETLLFWRDLSYSGMITESFSTTLGDHWNTASLWDGTVLFARDIWQDFSLISDAHAVTIDPNKDKFIPQSKLGQGNFILVFAAEDMNFFQLGGVASVGAPNGQYHMRNSIAPIHALQIDTKLDDGKPLSGDIRAIDGVTGLNGLAASGIGTCVVTSGGNAIYNAINAADTPLCQLRFLIQP